MSVTIEIEGVSDEPIAGFWTVPTKPACHYRSTLLDAVRKLVDVPTIEQMRERLEQAAPVELSIDPADVLRAERDTR